MIADGKKIKWEPILDEIYHKNFHLCYGGGAEEFIEFLEYYHKDTLTKNDREVIGGSKGCNYHNDTYHYVWVGECEEADLVLIHELFHYTTWVLHNAGIPFRDSTEEAYAYFIEYIYGKAMPKWAGLKKDYKLSLKLLKEAKNGKAKGKGKNRNAKTLGGKAVLEEPAK